MNTKLLKQKILDLSIRGKLTQQLKSDGTAADLLKEICDRTQEKTSLRAKRGNPSPQTIIPLDKSEAPFEIPANWEWVRLGDVVLNRDAERKPVSKKDRNLHAQKIYDYYGAAGAIDKVEEYLFDEKLLLIGEDGANLLSRSKPNAFLANGKYWVNNHAHVIDAIDKSMLDYLAFYINAISLDDFVTGTAQPKLNQENLNKIPIPLPPLAEQQRIVAKIEEAFAEIDAVEKNKELLKTHIKQTRQKILDLAIHGKLVPQDKNDEPASVLLERITRDNPHYEKIEDEPFEIPQNWVWCKLGNLFFHTTGKALKKANSTGIQRNYITTSNLYWCEFDLSEVRSMYFTEDELDKCTAKKGDLLLCNGGDVGRAAIWNFDYDICFQNHISRLRPKSVSLSNVFYLYVIRYNKEKGNLNGRGVGITSLSANDLLSLVVPLPPLNEQFRIVAKIEELFSTLDQMERNLV